jgi:hypothetical protein
MSFRLVSLCQKFFDMFRGYLECSIMDLLTLNLISQNAPILLHKFKLEKCHSRKCHLVTRFSLACLKGILECSIQDLLMLNLILQNDQILLR